jgi:hypothetical protein
MPKRHTVVTIEQADFFINGERTYKGRYWGDHRIEGLLMNSRMIQGIFDDYNPDTVSRWAYPDTGKWDADRNTREFIEHMPKWKEHGLLAFTIGLQGGSPEGYSKLQPWHNSAFDENGELDSAYMNRLEKIIDRADELGMVVILNYFYFGQDRRFASDVAVKQAVANATAWIMNRKYTNVILDLANECDYPHYTAEIIKAPNIHELLELARIVSRAMRPEYTLLIGTSFSGMAVPTNNVIAESDFILIHGNASNLIWLPQQIDILRNRSAYRGQPIVNNEDDHFDFDQEVNHMVLTIRKGVSWGYFDPGAGDYSDGYQCPPVNWGLNTARKQSFFKKLKEITGV